jgi:uncharacterized membrane protein
MAGSINFTNHDWLVRSFDRNNNKVMDELQVEDHVKRAVDTDKDGQVSTHELVTALKSDAVEINGGKIVPSKGMNIHVNGLETLRNVGTTARNNWGHVWTPSFSSEDTPSARYTKLVDSNRDYSSAINRMESALRSIRDMTANAPDATSRALHIQAKTTLNSASWRTWVGTFQELSNNGTYSDYNMRQMEMANTHFQAAYETLNTTLRSIAEQTKDLPDVQGSIKATDNSISKAFSNIAAIKNDSQSPDEVKTKLNRIADDKESQVTGRATPYAGIGAGVGAVGGGLIGFFAGGKSPKNAAIGAGIGAAVAAGAGGLIGHSIDMKFVGEAKTLRSLGDDVVRYNPDAAQGKLVNETQNTYNEILRAREHNDLDNARVSTNNFNTIRSRVAPIEQESEKVLNAYRMK